MKLGVGGRGGDAVDIAEGVGSPGGEDEEATLDAGLEALELGFPIWGDGLFLQEDEGEAALQGHILDALLSFGDAGGDKDRAALHDAEVVGVTLVAEGLRLVVRDTRGVGVGFVRREGEMGVAVVFALSRGEL